MTNAVKIMLRKIAVKIKNETEIQLMRILFKTNGSKATKNKTSKRAYPHGIERQYARKLRSFFEPLTTYVEKYINENMEPLLRGDSNNVRLDAIPGDSFRDMIYNLEDWLAVYMPDISDVPEDFANNVILTSIAKTAEEAKEFGDKEFQKAIEKGIHVNPPVASAWWNDMLKSWAEDNYTLITSNAKKYITQINTLTEQAIVSGKSPSILKEEIKKATQGLSDKHCKLLARDQMGKLNGQISQAQSQELGLELYVWSTSMDDKVRESHAVMEGLLCRYDDATVCSYDNGKTWVDRPSGAVQLNPGQDIQCRCVGLAFYPELTAEVENTSLSEQTEGIEPQIVDEKLSEDKIENIKDFDKINSVYEKLDNEYNSLLQAYRNETDEKLKSEILEKGKSVANLRRVAETRKNVLETIGRIPTNYEEVVEKLNSEKDTYKKFKMMKDDITNSIVVGKNEMEISDLKNNYLKALNITDVKSTTNWFVDEKGLFQFGELNTYSSKGIGDLVGVASDMSKESKIFQPKIYQSSLGEYFDNNLKYSKITEAEAIKMIPKGFTLNGVSNIEARELQNYTHFTPYNKYLREGGDVLSKKETATIKKVIDRTNSDAGTFYRGVRGEFADKLNSMKIGDTFTEKSFMSTSSDFSVAENFAGNEGIIMKINSKGGPGKSIFIESSEFGGESETLFNVNSKLKLIGRNKNILEFELK